MMFREKDEAAYRLFSAAYDGCPSRAVHSRFGYIMSFTRYKFHCIPHVIE